MNEAIYNRIVEHYDYVKQKGYNPIYIALQGSQNYQLDYEGSDIDTKAIVIPTLDEIATNAKPISTTIVLPNNEHCDVKDIRLMFENFKKQNINFLEILFTGHYFRKQEFAHLIAKMRSMNERIAHFNEYRAVKCMCGMGCEKYAALEKIYPATADKIEKFGYDPKQLHHIVRMEEFMQRYIYGEKFETILIPHDKKSLIDIKKGILPLESARELAARKMESLIKMKDEYCTNHLDSFNAGTLLDMNMLLGEFFKKSIMLELET